MAEVHGMDKEDIEMAIKKYKAKKKKRTKFDYTSSEFLSFIEDLAQKGYTDKNIAFALVAKYGDNLNTTYFNEIKNELNPDTGEPTERGRLISEALARGREKLNLFARDVYFKTATGLKKTKEVYRVFAEMRCECGGDMKCEFCHGTGKIVSDRKAVVQEVERDIAPNPQALSVWLFNYDKEWHDKVIESKKLDITTGGDKLQSPPRVLTKKEAKEYLEELDGDY